MFPYPLKRKIFILEEAFVGAGDVASTTDRGSARRRPRREGGMTRPAAHLLTEPQFLGRGGSCDNVLHSVCLSLVPVGNVTRLLNVLCTTRVPPPRNRVHACKHLQTGYYSLLSTDIFITEHVCSH